MVDGVVDWGVCDCGDDGGVFVDFVLCGGGGFCGDGWCILKRDVVDFNGEFIGGGGVGGVG